MVGTSCSGKTTFARRLATSLGTQHVELDSLYWGSKWTLRPDFNQRDLASVMAAAGYRESARTFLLWEGVTNYLTEAAVDTTLRWCAGASPGSLLLFTYVHRDVLTRPSTFVGTKNLFASLERAGEQLTPVPELLAPGAVSPPDGPASQGAP